MSIRFVDYNEISLALATKTLPCIFITNLKKYNISVSVDLLVHADTIIHF